MTFLMSTATGAVVFSTLGRDMFCDAMVAIKVLIFSYLTSFFSSFFSYNFSLNIDRKLDFF